MKPVVPNFVANQFAGITQTLFGEDVGKIQATVDTYSAKLGTVPTATALAQVSPHVIPAAGKQSREATAPYIKPTKPITRHIKYDANAYYTHKKDPEVAVCASTACKYKQVLGSQPTEAVLG